MSQPEKTFRIGNCWASVFVNTSDRGDGEQRSFRSVTVQRRYRVDDEWQSSNSYSLGDLPAALAVMQRAMDYVANQEASAQGQT